MKLITIVIIGLSLSMDAFSLALCYGSKGIIKRQGYILSLTVGIFHFFMPLLGFLFGNIVFKIFNINTYLIISVILFIIGIQMIMEGLKNKSTKEIYSLEILAFSLAVSIDSFSVGIGFNKLISFIILPCAVFAFESTILTYMGLKLGNMINNKYGKYANLLGGIILLLLGILYIM